MTEQERVKAERLMQRKEALNVSYREIASVYDGQTGKRQSIGNGTLSHTERQAVYRKPYRCIRSD